MTLRKTMLAASIAALPFMMAASAPAGAASLMAAPNAQSAQDNASLLSAMNAGRAKAGLDSRHGFVIGKQHPGTTGTIISRIDHTFQGVPVFQSESVVVSGVHGNIISESASDRRAGLARSNLDLNPRISGKDAIARVRSAVAPAASPIDPPLAQLIIYPVVTEQRVASAVGKAEDKLNATDLEEVVTGYKLAWLVTTRLVEGNTPRFHNTIVSAVDGSVLEQWNMVQTVVGVGNSQYNGTVPISTTQTASGYSMIDGTRGTGGTFGAMAITNANHTTSAGAVYTNGTNTWGDGKQYIAGGSTTNANGQTAAVNALWGLMNTYDMLKNTLGWQSLDGKNTATYIAAHVNTAYDNAYYSDTCKCMYIGDGSSFNSLGSIDVIGHEMSHGVTAATSNLTYRAESGGLNESSSDIGGEMVEAYARAGGTGTLIPAGNDWVMGKEISKTGTPLRYLYKPSKDGASPDAWNTRVKSLDVHYASGPNNRMFYFLSQGSSATAGDYYSAYLTQSPRNMTGIGNDKAYRIWFKAVTTKFTASTNYADARLKMIASAQELYGVGSAEEKAVKRAYAAINVGTDIPE